MQELPRGGEEPSVVLVDQSADSGLLPVFDAYMKMTGYEMEESINRETSGHLKTLLLAVGEEPLHHFNHTDDGEALQLFIVCSLVPPQSSVPGAFPPTSLRRSTTQ